MPYKRGTMQPSQAAAFGDRIRFAREREGMTQKQLTDRMGMYTGLVNKYENGLLYEPSFDHLRKLSSGLGVTIDYLVGEG